MNFWEKVDCELKYLGKSRKELANAVGFDVANISFGIRRGSVPYADTALKVARFLGVPLERLLGMDGDAPQDGADGRISEMCGRLRRFSRGDLDAVLAVVDALDEKY